MVHHRRFGRQRLCLSEELTTRANTAANIITTGANTLGADSAEVQAAQAALDDFSACWKRCKNGSKKQSLTSLPYYQGSAMHASIRPMRLWHCDRPALRKNAGAGC